MRSAHERFLNAMHDFPAGHLYKAAFCYETLKAFAQSIGCAFSDVVLVYGVAVEIDETLPPAVAELRNADRSIVHSFYLEGADR